MAWLTGSGNALAGFLNIGASFGESLVSKGSKAIASAPEFLGNVVAKAKTLNPFSITAMTQPVTTPTITKSPAVGSSLFSKVGNFLTSGFVGVGANTAQNISLAPAKPTGLTGAFDALTGFLNKTTSALQATRVLASTAKSTFGTIFGSGGAVTDGASGSLPSNFFFGIPAGLMSAFGGNQAPAVSPSGYVTDNSTSSILPVPSGSGVTAGVSVNSNILIIGIIAIIIVMFATRKA